MISWKEVSAAVSKVFALSAETQKNKVDMKQSLDEMARLRKQMQRGRREIDLMQMETGTRIAEINALISSIGNR